MDKIKALRLCHPRTHDVVQSNDYRQRGSMSTHVYMGHWTPANEAQDHSDFWLSGMTAGFFLSKTQVNKEGIYFK